MNLLLRQIWALVRKNLLLICVRRPFATFFRAILLPLAIVLIVGYSKNFFSSPEYWGVSEPRGIISLKDGLAATPDRSLVGFFDNGMQGGEISSVIDSLSEQIRSYGKTPRLFNNESDLAMTCRTDTSGASPCYAAIVFHSSPIESSDASKGTWNYTLRGLGSNWGGGFADIRSSTNGPQGSLLPFQRAVDQEIVSRSQSANTSSLPASEVILFTDQDQSALQSSTDSNYLLLAVNFFGPIFVFALVDVVYHMTSFVAHERELGMSGLIDTMISGSSNFRGSFVRQSSAYLSFAAIYLPSWLAVGIVISTVIFPVRSAGLPVAFLVLVGLSFTSFSLFGASFFKKSQLSGSIISVIIIVGAILPVVLGSKERLLTGLLSFFLPSANLSYFITAIGTFEAADKPVSMVWQAYDSMNSRMPLYVHWFLAVFHILAFPALAFAIERWVHSTASKHRTFAPPGNSGDATVNLTGFCKTYQPGFFSKVFRSRKAVHAVQNLDLKAYHGQILCLLGPNGCGKSTTLNCISGDQQVTSGSIVIDPTGGLGYAPQKNVIWPELTVEEHIRIFSDLKCLAPLNGEVVQDLAKGVDLQKKLHSRAHTLSGGQTRKLQMAMMFAGGSQVCCVDEVSTGLDPISRRRIWEILLAERTRRTIIMTTHYLDEADYLADEVAIMYKGSIKASGTTASLKHSHGEGYTVKLPYQTDFSPQLSGAVQKEQSRQQTVYRVATPALAAELAELLKEEHLQDYQISGPTMEELFLKVTGDQIHAAEQKAALEAPVKTKDDGVTINVTETDYELTEGEPVTLSKQWWLLLGKRARILRRRYVPYLVAIGFAIIGAAVARLLIKDLTKPLACPVSADLISDDSPRVDFGTSYYGPSPSGDESMQKKYVFGPSSRLDEFQERLKLMADVYSTENTPSQLNTGDKGYSNVSQIIEQLLLVDTYKEFQTAVQDDWKALGADTPTDVPSSDAPPPPSTNLQGGIWVGDDKTAPALLMNIGRMAIATEMTNFLTMMTTGVPISAAYDGFATIEIPFLIDMNALTFIIYFGLIMCCYPVFFALYPTEERLSNVRSMQYSNGIRPLPLWLSHLAFDSVFVIIISVIVTALLSIASPVWTGLGFIFVILVLYGMACAIISYIVSMLAKGAVSAWFIMAVGQIILYFAYFGGVIGVQSNTPYPDLHRTMDALFFGMGIISPVICLERALFIGLQLLAVMCNGQSLGSVYLYGGPILYLVLQGFILFAILLYLDNGITIPTRQPRLSTAVVEETELYTADLLAERKRLTAATTDLRIDSVSRSFGKNLAVDNVTFGVERSEIFALLGPNGAGKSTLISMIRGDIKPSTPESNIHIAGHSIRTNAVAARASLGVCPQFDSADALTVSETLIFYAKTRGVKYVDHNVSVVIAACGLSEYTNALAQTLSGGTKRKLSLAVALVGNPRVLVLDEPSSALDAHSKRTLWRCLQMIAKGRAVVLTTHSMEEADALADRIGIVASRMLALDEREELKRRAGQNFHIHLVCKSAPRTTVEELQGLKEWVLDAFPDAVISRETQGGQIRFEVPAQGRELVGLIRLLESMKERLGVEFYSVGKATLDEVFENIVRRYGDGEGVDI